MKELIAEHSVRGTFMLIEEDGSEDGRLVADRMSSADARTLAKVSNCHEMLRAALQLCYDHCRLYHPAVETNNVGAVVQAALDQSGV